MRLHHLEVQAFQAFAGCESVDFDRLNADGLFLLRGDTGAGKTTLLDAVCFAFYGELPGARGRDARVRSDHAAADLPTQVVLEATLRGTRVRITRSPAQERPKARGEGLTKEAAKVLVEAFGADGAVRVLATRHDEAGEELGRLLGLTREQFCQVVLLPQGEFATFLRAKSEERKELLTKLFSAERFVLAEEWLTRRAKEAYGRVRVASEAVADIASRIAQETAEEAPEDWRDDPALLLAWLGERQVLAEAQRATATEAREVAASAERVADEALRTGLGLADRRARHAAASAAAARLAAAEPEHEARVAELAAARRAVAVVPLAREAAARAGQAELAAAEREALLAAVDDGTGREETPLRSAGDAARRAAGEAHALLPVEMRVGELRGEAGAVAAKLVQTRAAVGDLDRRLAQAGPARAALVARHATAVNAAALAAGLQESAAVARRRADAALQRDAARAQAAQVRTERDAAREAANVARAAWLDLREARLAGMAAELADGLGPGEPCVVCGATEHPHPAVRDTGAPAVTAAQEHQAGALADERRSAADALDAALADAGSHIAAAQAIAGEDPAQELADAAARVAREHAETVALADTAAACEAALEAHDEEATRWAADRARLAEELAAGEARALELEALAQADAERLAAALGDAPDVAALVASHERRAAALDAAADAVATAQRAAAEARAAAAAADAEATRHGFADTATARAAARAPEAVAALEQAVRAHEEAVVETRAILSDPDVVAAAAAAAPDVPALQRARQEAAGRLGEAERAVERSTRHASSLAALERTLRSRLEALTPLQAEATRIRELAALADGSAGANRKKMRLSAYVLAARLEEIAAAASVRLEAMSGGRYTLVHSDEGGRRARQHGLDLRVVDGWTGQERGPSTLSGGETFLASLALALGLADVVAAEAGGARLETLFVDEGFGSLDEAALDEVLDVLDRLRDGGRTVGVVSHVAELRQRITAQVHVVKGRDGSRVEQAVAAG